MIIASVRFPAAAYISRPGPDQAPIAGNAMPAAVGIDGGGH